MGNELFSLSNKESRVKWSACIIGGQFLRAKPASLYLRRAVRICDTRVAHSTWLRNPANTVKFNANRVATVDTGTQVPSIDVSRLCPILSSLSLSLSLSSLPSSGIRIESFTSCKIWAPVKPPAPPPPSIFSLYDHRAPYFPARVYNYAASRGVSTLSLNKRELLPTLFIEREKRPPKENR